MKKNEIHGYMFVLFPFRETNLSFNGSEFAKEDALNQLRQQEKHNGGEDVDKLGCGKRRSVSGKREKKT